MSTFSDETSLEGGTTRKLLSLRHTHGSAPRSPYLPCQITSYGSKGKFGATAELRNILQEKMRDKGSSSSRCDRRFGKKKQHRCLLTQSLSPTRIHVSPNQTCLPYVCVKIQSRSTNPRFARLRSILHMNTDVQQICPLLTQHECSNTQQYRTSSRHNFVQQQQYMSTYCCILLYIAVPVGLYVVRATHVAVRRDVPVVFIWACHRPTLVGRPIIFLYDGPRPGPARQTFRGWAAARPSPSHFQKFTARPGPAHHFLQSLGPARPITWQRGR